MAPVTVRVRYESGHETDIDVPDDGTLARELFDEHVAKDRYVIIGGLEGADVEVEVPSDDDQPGDDGRPAKSAPKAEWEAYAAAQGATGDELAEATKADLIERYGS